MNSIANPVSRLIVISLLTLASLACSDDDGFNQAADEARLDSQRAEIRALVANVACSETSECQCIGLGSKPCGGPWEYLIYSEKVVNPADLEVRVEAYNAFEQTLNQRYGYASDCSVPQVPELVCRENRCVDLND